MDYSIITNHWVRHAERMSYSKGCAEKVRGRLALVKLEV